MNTALLLENCARIERLVADIYLLFMEQQSSDPYLCAVWKKTAHEEENHEQQFMLAKRLLKVHDMTLDLAPERVEAVMNSLNTLLSRLRTNPPDSRESLRLAISIEEKLAESHLNYSMTFADESMSRLFKSMMKFDKDHLGTLREAYIRYGGDASQG